MADATPVDEDSKEATFTALAVDFKLNNEEKETDEFVAAVKSLEGSSQRIQVARVRSA